MSTTTAGFEPDPEDWEDLGHPEREVTPEALENEPDDIVAALAGERDPLPADADEADALEQRAEVPLDIDDEGPPEA